MTLSPLDAKVFESFIAANNRFFEASAGKGEVESITDKKSGDPLLTDYAYFTRTVVERSSIARGADKQKAAVEACCEELFLSVRKCYLAGLSLLIGRCENLFKKYKPALTKIRGKAGFAKAPTTLALEKKINDVKASFKNIEATNASPGLQNTWKPQLDSWKEQLEAAKQIIYDMDEYLEKMNQYGDNVSKNRRAKVTVIFGAISLLAGGGVVKDHWPTISAWITSIGSSPPPPPSH